MITGGEPDIENSLNQCREGQRRCCEGTAVCMEFPIRAGTSEFSLYGQSLSSHLAVMLLIHLMYWLKVAGVLFDVFAAS